MAYSPACYYCFRPGHYEFECSLVPGRCHRCSRVGHIAKYCRLPKHCLRCDELGHSLVDCNALQEDFEKRCFSCGKSDHSEKFCYFYYFDDDRHEPEPQPGDTEEHAEQPVPEAEAPEPQPDDTEEHAEQPEDDGLLLRYRDEEGLHPQERDERAEWTRREDERRRRSARRREEREEQRSARRREAQERPLEEAEELRRWVEPRLQWPGFLGQEYEPEYRLTFDTRGKCRVGFTRRDCCKPLHELIVHFPTYLEWYNSLQDPEQYIADAAGLGIVGPPRPQFNLSVWETEDMRRARIFGCRQWSWSSWMGDCCSRMPCDLTRHNPWRPTVFIHVLHDDIMFKIFGKLSVEDLDTCEVVCRRWQSLIHRIHRMRRQLMLPIPYALPDDSPDAYYPWRRPVPPTIRYLTEL